MIEYCIWNFWNGGKPFILSQDIYNDFILAKFKLEEYVALERERNRPYYVDNDFFENEYPYNINGKIFCIKEREITEWKKVSEKNKIKNISNKVIKIY